VKLKAIFPNNDDALFPNQFVNARLLVETEHDATLVPTAAIQRNGQGAFVYVVKPDKTALMQTVKVGTTDGNVAAVDGIAPNATLAVSGFDRLQDGSPVAIRDGGSGGRGNGQGGPAPQSGSYGTGLASGQNGAGQNGTIGQDNTGGITGQNAGPGQNAYGGRNGGQNSGQNNGTTGSGGQNGQLHQHRNRSNGDGTP
jgi:hypothetical protein